MSPDDPRHGTESGEAQHVRDGEEPCGPCRDAKLRASRRRWKRKTMGHRYMVPVGADNHHKLSMLRRKGATWGQLAEWCGLSTSQVWRVVNTGPETLVYSRTAQRVAEMSPRRIITPVGVTRRIRALACLGWSIRALANETGVDHDTILAARRDVRNYLQKHVEKAVADAYERLCMTPATGQTQQQRAGVTRNRNAAIRQGWAPPLAWQDIDDPDEQPATPYAPRRVKRDAHDIDPVLVQRILDGDLSLAPVATRAERREIYKTWTARGHSPAELERATGWPAHRYWKAGDAA